MVLLKNTIQYAPESGDSGSFIDDDNAEAAITSDLNNDGGSNPNDGKHTPAAKGPEKEDDDDDDDANGTLEDDEDEKEEEDFKMEDDDTDADINGEKDKEKEKEVVADDKTADEDADADTTWDGIAKDLGIEVTAPIEDFDSFKATFEKTLETREAAAFQKGKAEAGAVDLVKEFGAEGAYRIQALRAGITEQELNNPTSGYEPFLQMNPEAFMRSYLKDLKLSPEAIDKRITYLQETEQLEIEHAQLKSNVEQVHASIVQNKVQEKISAVNALKENFISLTKEEDDKLSQTIMGMETYSGKKVSKEIREKIDKNWKSGYYRERFQKDEKFVAKMLFDYHLGESAKKKAVDAATTDTQKKADRKLATKLHNLPPKTGAGGRTLATKPSNSNDEFADWDQASKEPFVIKR